MSADTDCAFKLRLYWVSAAVVANAPAMTTGTGARLDAITPFPTLHIVLVNPMAPVPSDKTAQVFRALGLAPVPASITEYARPRPPSFERAAVVIDFIARHDNQWTASACSVVPGIADVIAALKRLPDCRVARMSGAGPTCFGLFESLEAAQKAACDLRIAYPNWWIHPTRLC